MNSKDEFPFFDIDLNGEIKNSEIEGDNSSL